MAIVDGSRVEFIYVDGNTLPSEIKESAVYFISGSKQIFIGTERIADLTDYEMLSGTYVAGGELQNGALVLLNGDGEPVATIALPGSPIIYGTVDYWNSHPEIQSEPGCLYIYTDYKHLDGKDIPGMKFGDGNAYVIDLPFFDEMYAAHIIDTNIHVTPEEKEFWNNKVTCYLDPVNDENLIFSKD